MYLSLGSFSADVNISLPLNILSIAAEETGISKTFSLPTFCMTTDFSSLLDYKEDSFASKEKYLSLLYSFSTLFFGVAGY